MLMRGVGACQEQRSQDKEIDIFPTILVCRNLLPIEQGKKKSRKKRGRAWLEFRLVNWRMSCYMDSRSPSMS